MNEITTSTQQLPDTIEDLSKFVLVGKATLQAYMMRIRTINRLSVAQEVRDQTLQEAQEVSTALIAAEQRIGELLLSIPKASGNQYTSASAEDTAKAKTKAEVIAEQGYERHEASDYQQMAKHPEVVQKVIKDALDSGDVVTKSSVMREIKFYKDRIRTLEEQAKKPVTKEVVPDDYEALKARAESAAKSEKRMADDYHKLQKELADSKSRIKDLEAREGVNTLKERAEKETEYFTLETYRFIRESGGHVWVFEQIKDVPAEKVENFKKAIYALDAFAKQMIQNIGGYSIE